MDMSDILKKHFASIEDKFGPLPDQVNVAMERLTALEQKAARRGPQGHGGDAEPTWGSQLIGTKAADLAALKDQRSGRVAMHYKAAITSATANAAGSAGSLVVPQRDQLAGMPKRRLTIRDLLTVIPVESGAIEYPKQKLRTNNSAVVAEGAQKPSSELQYDLQSVPIRTIAHFVKASRQILDDAPQLQGEIDGELIYGLALTEEAELLTGDGTGQHLNGMVTQATAYSAAMALADLTAIDVIGLAILQASLTDVEPDGIIVHPADWWAIRLSKTSDGKYLFGDPGVAVTPSLFGLPLVPTKAMTLRKFMVGAFKAQTLYDRWEARVEVGFENDDFTKNMVTILGEERIGFAAKVPQALIYGDFDSALAM